jgi:hypothetical protein
MLSRTRREHALSAVVQPAKAITLERLAHWTRGIALVVLAWAVLAPGGLFWTAVLALGVIGASLATAVLVHSRRIPTLAQVIASAQAEPAGAPAGGCSGTAGPSSRQGR